MGEHTGIEWCHHTFSPWWGCTKVSAGCKYCYAEGISERFSPGNWGPEGDRRFFGDKYWAQPLKWDRKAAAAGVRRRVFCGSMCDVFEDRADLKEPRGRLWELIEATPNLDWLLLTKRPENISRLVRQRWLASEFIVDRGELTPCFPPNVWIGTSVEDQQSADERIPVLLSIPARIRFLSCEPLLGEINLQHAGAIGGYLAGGGFTGTPLTRGMESLGIHWVIAGGESGPDARPMHPSALYSLCSQCVAAGVAFFFKQHGEWIPSSEQPAGEIPADAPRVTLADLQDVFAPGHEMIRAGKKAAGRLLAGREWNEFPA